MNRNLKKKISANRKYLEEILWANIYHDSIRGKNCLENLPMNIGRWAGNYTFFYILHRLLTDFKPQSILELGLGESTKFISTFCSNYLPMTSHHVVEHDKQWITKFEDDFQLNAKTEIIHLELEQKENKNTYQNFTETIIKVFDLYIIDGPFGSPSFSRNDLYYKFKKSPPTGEFIILFDDTDRSGERETMEATYNLLRSQGLEVQKVDYHGVKSVSVICTPKYKHAINL